MPKIKEIRRNICDIKIQKKISALKIKETEKNLLELEKILSKLKKYYDYDDIEYKGIRDVSNLFFWQLIKIVINQQEPKVL